MIPNHSRVRRIPEGPVNVKGRVFASFEEARLALCPSRSAGEVRSRLRLCTLAQAMCETVCDDDAFGIRFPNTAAAEKALGIPRSEFYNSGWTLETLPPRAVELPEGTFPSVPAARDAVCPHRPLTSIYSRMGAGYPPDACFAPMSVPLPSLPGMKVNPVVLGGSQHYIINGVWYPNLTWAMKGAAHPSLRKAIVSRRLLIGWPREQAFYAPRGTSWSDALPFENLRNKPNPWIKA